MKKIFIYLIILLGVLAMFSSCDKEFEQFAEPSKYYGTAPSSVSNIVSEALPGQIALTWTVPTDSNYYFMRISYYDHLTKKNVSHLTSVYTNSLLISDTRAKYGDYDFSFQSFNSKNEGGEVIRVKAKSGIAPTIETVTKTKIALTEGQLSTNAQEPSEGPLKNLLDGDSNSFFHTRWSSPQISLPHWIDVRLNEPHENIAFFYQNRNGSQVGPRELDIQVGNDGINWTSLGVITTGLPSGSKAEYHSDVFTSSTPFTYFRFKVTATYGDTKYFNLAEFALYDAKIDIYDPESPDVD